MNKNKKLLNENIPTLIKQLAIPASTGMIFNTLYNVVDTFYAGLISTQAIAALSLSFMIFFLIIGFGYGFSSAITAIIGNYLGNSKQNIASIYAQKGLLFLPMIGLILGIVGYFVSPSLFMILGAKEAYLDDAMTYITPILFGASFFMGNYALNAILVASGDTKSFRNTLIFGFFANLALNPVFMYGFLFIPAFGLQGIAIATVLIQVLTMLYLAKKVLDLKMIKYFNIKYFLPDTRVYKQFFVQGVPSSLNMLIMAFGSLLLMYFVTLYGVDAVAGYGIGYRVEQLMLLPALGLNTAVLTIISNNYGAKNYDRVIETLKVALKYGFYISTFGIVFLIIFGKFIVSLFDPNPAVVSYGYDYLIVEIFIFYAYITLFICVSTLQGIKRPKMIVYIALYRQLIAKFIVAYLLVIVFEVDYIYLWFGILAMIYSAAIFAYFYTNSLLKKVCSKSLI